MKMMSDSDVMYINQILDLAYLIMACRIVASVLSLFILYPHLKLFGALGDSEEMGIFASKNFNPDRDIPDLTGKVILVTGGKCVARPFHQSWFR